MYLIFDTETTGLPRNFKAPITDTDNWPRVVQLAWQLHDINGKLLRRQDALIQPEGFTIPYDSEQVHGISTALAAQEGLPLREVVTHFLNDLEKAQFVVGHNLTFDLNVLGCELVRLGLDSTLHNTPVLDTCTEETAARLKLPGGKGGKFKLPTLTELYRFLFEESFAEAHNATADVEATTRCFLEMIRLGHFSKEALRQDEEERTRFQEVNPHRIALLGIEHKNLKAASKALKKASVNEISLHEEISEELEDAPFTHLHVHSQYTLLQSTAEIKALVQKAIQFNMPALALTDNGNMMAAFQFEKVISEHNKKIEEERLEAEENGSPFSKKPILPIIGCEFNVCRDRKNKNDKDNGYKIVLLAKNKRGYQQLIKMASMAYIEGFYYVPRVDKALIEQYKEELIALSGGIEGEIGSLILNVGENQAEEALIWWKSQFGEDFYLEINRNKLEAQEHANEVLVRFAKKHSVALVATNNTYYVEQSDAKAHDVLLCVREGELVSTPIGRGKGYRYGFANDEFYFKSPEQMKRLFANLPEAILSIGAILEKCEPYSLSRSVLLPKFDIPQEFIDPSDETEGTKNGENAYLRHLTYLGAEKRYGALSEALVDRLDFELKTIENTGYPGYFLIVQDFCKAAREMDVAVGPGRGSAAGSAVAYCIGITNIDPIKYDLLFERFLNPDRISMPDIDIDFDDEGRGKVIDYVIKKYGSNQVAQIITYGTMAAKSAIRDTARVMDLSLPEADRLAKLVPDLSLKKLFEMDDLGLMEALKNNADALNNARELKKIFQGSGPASVVLHQAKAIEGSVRNTGIHACGVVITPDDITNFVPVATAKDSDMYCTQFDNSVAEAAGLLKMDFLGLKTLTLIKDALRIIKENRGIDLDADEFPIDDEATYQLFQRGETVGVFQYESTGMQKYMRELKPTEFSDLIAMNALYRPGPLEYIPSYIKRKHGYEKVVYDLEDCAEFLQETYGITVYQEQVMLLSQKLADFSKGEADSLRKAMGKKDIKVLDKMRPLFFERGTAKGHDVVKLEKIWKDWEAFASYAFNKSHSTCYAWVAYQTAYLKANYPSEFMASVLSNNMNDLSQVGFFMEECRRMGVAVLGPDVNESRLNFTVNQEGAIRFGLKAVKGVGEAPVEAILKGRSEQRYAGIFDFCQKVDFAAINQTAFKHLIYAGAFDSFQELNRAQFFATDNRSETPFYELLMRYGQACKSEGQTADILFPDDVAYQIVQPSIPKSEPWSSGYTLGKEKEVIGIYISGHPMDDFKREIDAFCYGNVAMMKTPEAHLGRELFIPVVVLAAEQRQSQKGNAFGTILIEDYTDQFKLSVFGENYLRFKHLFQPGVFLTLRGKIDASWNGPRVEFVLNDVELLQNLRDKRVKGVHLTLSNKEVNHLLIEELNEILMAHQGPCDLKFTIMDPVEGIELNMTSKTLRVKPDTDLYDALTKINVPFRLN
jgi:DNA polymerase-3 subunit alpha